MSTTTPANGVVPATAERFGPIDPDLIKRLHHQVGDGIHREHTRRAHEGLPELSPETENQLARALIAEAIRQHNAALIAQADEPLSRAAERELAEGVHNRLFGAGRLQRLLEDHTIENIDINGADEVWVTRAGSAYQEPADPVATSDAELIEMVQVLGSYAGLNSRAWDAANPELDLQLPDGSRLSAVMGVCQRPSISIRRHRLNRVRLADLEANGTISTDAAAFARAVVKARCNVMIAGATSAGKTTMLRALAAEIDPRERIVTVERAFELGLRQNTQAHPNCVAFEERLANSEGAGAISLARLVKRTLRQNPDRVIVGEVLGEEVIDMLNAMGQGNDGSLSTIHARSARDTFGRVATYAIQAGERLPHEATYQLIAGGLDFVFFVSRSLETGRRRLESVLEVNGFDNTVLASEIFALQDDGTAQWTGTTPARIELLRASGWTPPNRDGWQPE